ncbi:hypothetical protein [Flavobacterium laiguense]|uniref:Lipoprotein n=1 Tax=Flavobacterium laiguense TaxID=2169409 RepID=A0A2U1JKS8_9FLAO|nr:hypothetical protein [Flavobacterium laiguense]PWA05752.1 hypothetical protein DB891_16665 [Flavobacterium laiguense]
MKKVALLLLLVMNLISCQYLSQLNSDKELTKIIESKIKDNSMKIDLTKIDNIDYDKLLILEPYSNIQKTEIELNIDLSNISKNYICNSDGINLLVFLKNGKSIKISELNRTNGDFKDCKVFINRKNALFEKNEKGIIALIK